MITVHLRVPRKLRRRAKAARVLSAFTAWRFAGSPRPVVPDEPCNSDVSIRLSDDDLAEIDAAALDCGLSRASFVRGLLAEYGGARSARARKHLTASPASLALPAPRSSSTGALVRVPRALVIESGRLKILEGEFVDAVPARRPPTLLERRFYGPGHPLNEAQPQPRMYGLTEAQQNKVRNELFTALCESQRQNDALRQQLRREQERRKPLLSRLLGL